MTVPADDAMMTPQIFRSASEAVALLVPVNVCAALVDVGVVMANKVPHETGARKHSAACHPERSEGSAFYPVEEQIPRCARDDGLPIPSRRHRRIVIRDELEKLRQIDHVLRGIPHRV